MYRFAPLVIYKLVAYLLAVGAGVAIHGANKKRRRMEAYKVRNPSATPREVELFDQETEADLTFEAVFEKYRGLTRSRLGFAIHWFRDTRGRARVTYSTSPYHMRHMMFREWCLTPPTEFRI